MMLKWRIRVWQWVCDAAGRLRHPAPGFVLLAIVVIGLFAVIWVPKILVEPNGLSPEAYTKAIEDSRKTWTQFMAGVGGLYGLYLLWRRTKATEAQTKATEDTLKTTLASLDLNRQGQITDRLTKAVEQLGAVGKDGNKVLEIRIGGIYALERIAWDSVRDHWTVVEVLCAYVRHNASWDEKFVAARVDDHAEPAMDIQAAVTVIGRRDTNRDVTSEINLTGVDLRRVSLERAKLGANLHKDPGFSIKGSDLGPGSKMVRFSGATLNRTHLEGANLSGAHLERAKLRNAHLEGAQLFGAHLDDADLTAAHLEGAHLFAAHLDNVTLNGAHLEGADLNKLTKRSTSDDAEESIVFMEAAYLKDANLSDANLRGAWLAFAHCEQANLRGADLTGAHLKQTDLRGAHLEGANLTGAYLEQVILTDAHLEGADIRNCVGLTPEQVRVAFIDENTKLPFDRSLLDLFIPTAEPQLDADPAEPPQELEPPSLSP